MADRARLALARAIRGRRERVAAAVLQVWDERHPGWMERFGPRARQRSLEDLEYHVDYLASAVIADEPAAFAGYIGWTRSVLEARGVGREVLEESLRLLEQALAADLDPHGRTVLSRYLAAGAAAAREPAADPEPLSRSGDAAVYLEAILSGRREAAFTVARAALEKAADLAVVYAEVVEPAMVAVGQRWEHRLITVADEHVATAVTQYVMARLYPLLEPPPPSRGRVVVAGIEGEYHQVGAAMVADVLELDGWNVRFLGANVPVDATLGALAGHGASVLGLSATLLSNIDRVAELIGRAREETPELQRVVVGGALFRIAPEAWRRVGADAVGTSVSDVRAAFSGSSAGS